jgi:hypothetical protein
MVVMELLMEGLIFPIGMEGLRKSPDGGKTLVQLTESDVEDFCSGHLLVESKDEDGEVTYHPRPGSFLTERKSSDGFLYVYGPMAQCDKRNGNGRIYERSIWTGINENEKTISRTNEGDSKGHLEHPKDGRTNLNLVSHVMVPAGKKGEPFVIDEDGTVYGKARILNTAPGKQLQELYRGGVRVGFSSRGKGSTYRKQNSDYVAKDYMYDVMDAVASPSVSIATPKLENHSVNFKSSLASSQVESIQSLTEATSPMTNAKDLLKELETGLRGISGKLEESKDAISLASLRENLLDSQMAIRAVVESDPTTRDVAEELLGHAKELRSKVTIKMESLTDNNLDESIQEAVTHKSGATDEVAQLRSLLSETKERLDYYRILCEELAESDDSVTRKEYEASLALSEGLLKKCKEFQADNVQLLEALEESVTESEGAPGTVEEHPDFVSLHERYEKALLIIEELTDRIRGAQVSDRVEEVIRQEPRFAKIRDDLLECATVDEVNSRINRLGRLLGESTEELVLEENEELPAGESYIFEETLEESPVDGEEPQAYLTEAQSHRMGLINAICGGNNKNFRK